MPTINVYNGGVPYSVLVFYWAKGDDEFTASDSRRFWFFQPEI